MEAPSSGDIQPALLPYKASKILAAGLPSSIGATSLADTLSSTEVDLLARYLMHTSHIIPIDSVDVFALQIGIPSLAFGSAPLMDSILALSAVCRCHEILKASDLTVRDWGEVEDLLTLENHHFESSLRRIQDSLRPGEERYNDVLANATVMVLYGSASHSLRIKVTQRCSDAGGAFPPAPLQWTRLIRAAHMAYTGLSECRSTLSSSGSSPPVVDIDNACTTSSEDGPTARTRHLIQPIILGTAADALSTLGDRLQDALDTYGEGTTSDTSQESLRSCFQAFQVLSDTVDLIVFHSRPSSPQSDERSTHTPASEPDSALFTVSPWLRTYVAQVTSAVPQKQLRRIIMSFLNRVPLSFLDLVQDDSDSPESRLALDIFGHWLVLVTLLDGVWWIDGIGEWELERAVRRFRQMDGGEEEWWPEKMLEARRKLLG